MLLLPLKCIQLLPEIASEVTQFHNHDKPQKLIASYEDTRTAGLTISRVQASILMGSAQEGVEGLRSKAAASFQHDVRDKKAALWQPGSVLSGHGPQLYKDP